MAIQQRLSKEEKKAQDFIALGFEPHKGEWMNTANRLLSAFRGKYYTKEEPRRRFVVNTISSLVNLFLPNFVFQQPHIQVKPKTPRYMKPLIDGEVRQINNVQATRVREAAINWLYDKINAFGEDQKATQDALFYGFGICKNGYSFETITKYDKDYIQKDTPFRKRVDPKDFGWHPLATGLDDSEKLVHRVLMTKDELKENKSFSNVNDVVPSIPKHLQQKLSKANVEEFVAVNEVSCQMKDMIYTFGGENNVLLKKAKNEYNFNGPQFSRVQFVVDNENFQGIPLLSMIEDQAEALNEINSLIVEHFRKFPGQVFVERGSVDEDDMDRIRTGEQGSIHQVNDITKINHKPPLQMGAEYFNIVNLQQSVIDRVLAVPDFQRLAGGGRKSASEAAFIQGDITLRRSFFLNEVKDFILDGVEKLASLQAQFQDEKVEIMAMGEISEPIVFDKSDLQGEFIWDFDVENLSAANEAELTNIMNIFNILASHPALQPILKQFDPQKLGKFLFKKINMNVESFTTEEIENVVHIPAERENELARRGEPMPQPKRGENRKEHIDIHSEDLRQNGQNEQILDHLATTIVMDRRERGFPEQQATPQAGQQQATSPAEAAQPEGPVGPLQGV